MNRRNFMGKTAAAAAIGAAGARSIRAFMPLMSQGANPITLPELPWERNALQPHISSRTIDFHYGKHHKGYVDKLNELIKGGPMAEMTLEDIVLAAHKEKAEKPEMAVIYNNAAQIWNHTFYWRSMKPKGGGEPAGKLLEMIGTAFGGVKECKAALAKAATTQFGSGWAWLVQNGDALEIAKTGNADCPCVEGKKPLLTIDVWEHAYYLDFQNARAAYVEAWLENLVNWEFAAQNLGG